MVPGNSFFLSPDCMLDGLPGSAGLLQLPLRLLVNKP